jgi:hypothetical protein
VMKNGRVVEDGEFAEMIQPGTVFKELLDNGIIQGYYNYSFTPWTGAAATRY